MAFIEQKSVRSKRGGLDNHILETVVKFMYLGCRFSGMIMMQIIN